MTINDNRRQKTEDRRQNSAGGSVKRSLAMAIPNPDEEIGIEAATQRRWTFMSLRGAQRRRNLVSQRRRLLRFARNDMGTMRCGFSLAEAMMAVVVLGIAAAGVLLPFSSGARVRSEGTHRTLGAKLASHLMEQIVHTPFDQIMDYNGYAEAEGQVKNAAGGTFSDLNYAKFSRNVSCTYVYVPQESGATQPVFIRVTVQVLWSGKDVATINRLVSE